MELKHNELIAELLPYLVFPTWSIPTVLRKLGFDPAIDLELNEDMEGAYYSLTKEAIERFIRAFSRAQSGRP